MTSEELKEIRDCRALLERIAIALEALTGAPVNQYGETFAEAIQNGHARGLRGITTYD